MSNELKEFVKKKEIIKLHLGCGGQKWEDFINVDFYEYNDEIKDASRNGCVADVYTDMRSLGLDDNTITEIFTSHTIEHFTRWETIDMLEDWYRMLLPNGKIIIETPNFNRCLLWLLSFSSKKRKLAHDMFYGNQWDRLDYETHRYVWRSKELISELKKIGFRSVEFTKWTQTHYQIRDMRVSAIK